jgi:hypothetical protein
MKHKKLKKDLNSGTQIRDICVVEDCGYVGNIIVYVTDSYWGNIGVIGKNPHTDTIFCDEDSVNVIVEIKSDGFETI